MSALRALIVDDEPLAREGLADYLGREPDVDVVELCGDGVAAMAALERHDPDVVFLDIQMPEMTGFELIEAVGPDRMPPVVFVTAYDEFALDAFEAAAVDYVLKPFDPDRVARAVDRARRFVDTGDGGGGPGGGAGGAAGAGRQALEELLARIGERVHLRKFAVRDDESIRFVDTAEVAWIEAAGNYVRLHTGRGEYRFRSTMGSLERRLDPAAFVRVHRSSFVRTDRIDRLEPLHQGDYVVVLDDGSRVPTSRSFRDNVRALMDGIV